MILEPFQYFSPTKISEAQEILLKYGEDAKVLAGGQSLIPILKMDMQIPCIVDIKNIQELAYLKESEGHLEVGALEKYSEIEYSDLVKRKLPLLSKTVAGIGHPLVRNRGTIGGSLSHCDPAADLCVTSLALDGTISIASRGGKKRAISAVDFFKGPLTTDLQLGEILFSISYPLPKGKTGYDIQKLTLGHGDFPLLVVSVFLEFDGQKFNKVRIAYGGVAETAVRSQECEKLLEGRDTITEKDIEGVSELAMELLDPPVSLELSPEYTKQMIGVYTGRALRNAVQLATG